MVTKKLMILFSVLIAIAGDIPLWGMEKDEKKVVAYIDKENKKCYVLAELKGKYFHAPSEEDLGDLKRTKANDPYTYLTVQNATLPKKTGKIFRFIELTHDTQNVWPVNENSAGLISVIDSDDSTTAYINETLKDLVKKSGLIDGCTAILNNNKINAYSGETPNSDATVKSNATNNQEKKKEKEEDAPEKINSATPLMDYIIPIVATIAGGLCGYLAKYGEENIDACKNQPLTTGILGFAISGSISSLLAMFSSYQKKEETEFVILAGITGCLGGYCLGRPLIKKLTTNTIPGAKKIRRGDTCFKKNKNGD